MKTHKRLTRSRQFLQSPYLFMTTSLVPADTQYADASLAIEKGLCGAVVSSLHKLKDTDSKGEW